MTALEIPQADEAERISIACAIETPDGAELAHARLQECDFRSPARARLFAATANLGDIKDEADRIGWVAAVAGVDEAGVLRLVRRNRPVQFDRTGYYAGEVVDAAIRRRLMAAAGEAYNALGLGAVVHDVVPMLEQMLRMARGERLGTLVDHGWRVP